MKLFFIFLLLIKSTFSFAECLSLEVSLYERICDSHTCGLSSITQEPKQFFLTYGEASWKQTDYLGLGEILRRGHFLIQKIEGAYKLTLSLYHVEASGKVTIRTTDVLVRDPAKFPRFTLESASFITNTEVIQSYMTVAPAAWSDCEIN